MSHHYSGPDFGFPHADARLDLCKNRQVIDNMGRLSRRTLAVQNHYSRRT